MVFEPWNIHFEMSNTKGQGMWDTNDLLFAKYLQYGTICIRHESFTLLDDDLGI